MLNKFYENLDRYCESAGEGEVLGWTLFLVKAGPQRDDQDFGVYATPCEAYLVAPSGVALVVRDGGEWQMLRADGTQYGDSLGALGDLPDLRGGCPVKALLGDARNRAEQAVREMDYDASVVRHGALRASGLMCEAAAFAMAAEFLEG